MITPLKFCLFLKHQLEKINDHVQPTFVPILQLQPTMERTVIVLYNIKDYGKCVCSKVELSYHRLCLIYNSAQGKKPC